MQLVHTVTVTRLGSNSQSVKKGRHVDQLESWFDAGQAALFPWCFEALSMYLRARSKQYALALRFNDSGKNKETALLEWTLRHFVEHCQTVTPMSDSSVAILQPLRAGHRRIKNSTMFGSDATTCFSTSADNGWYL